MRSYNLKSISTLEGESGDETTSYHQIVALHSGLTVITKLCHFPGVIAILNYSQSTGLNQTELQKIPFTTFIRSVLLI